MKKMFLIIAAAISCSILNAQEINFGLKSNWHRSKVYLKADKEGFKYNCFKYYSVIDTGFDKIELDVDEEISLSFKIKGIGKLKPDSAGFRFGLYGKSTSGKTVGYVINYGVEKKGASLLMKTANAPGLLSGKGFRGIGGAKSGIISSETFSDLKFTITNLGDDELEFKLYIDSVLTIKCKRSSMKLKAFSSIALGTGGQVNSFIIKDLKVKKGK